MTAARDRGSSEWVRLGPLDELPRGQAIRVDLDGHPIALFHTARGVCAIDGRCPHAGGELSDGEFDDAVVTCPWHRWRFDLRTGERHDRRGQPVDVYPTRVTDGWVWLAFPRRG